LPSPRPMTACRIQPSSFPSLPFSLTRWSRDEEDD
jgi:hypothetical protein